MARLIAIALALAAPQNVEKWRPIIAEASAKYDVPEEWIVRAMSAESGGRRDAVSSKGAIGLMQLMPGTWLDMRGRLSLGTDPYDPRDNILAGTYYLKQMHARFGYPGLFAAYNAGPDRYAQYLSGARPLPGETIAYLAAVTGVSSPPLVQAEGPDPARSPIFFPLAGTGSKR